MNNKDGELTEEEYREVIKYGRGMLINIIIGVVAAVVIAVYMGMLKKGVVFLMLLLPLRQYCGGYHMKNHNKCKEENKSYFNNRVIFICYFYCIIKNGLRINCSFVYCYSSGIAYIREYK